MKFGIAFGFLCLAVAVRAPAVRAQGPKAPVPGLSLSWRSGADSLVLEARVSLPAGWYINSDSPLDSFLVPTRLEAAAIPGSGEPVRFGPPRWPKPVVEHSPAMGGDMSLFKESFTVTLPALPARTGNSRAGKAETGPSGAETAGAGKAGAGGTAAGKSALPGRAPAVRATLQYQSCDGTMCWPPKSVSAVWEDGRSRQE